MPENENPEPEKEAQEAPDDGQNQPTDQPDEDDDAIEAWDPKRAKNKIAKLNREAAALREKASTAETQHNQKSEQLQALEAANRRMEVALDLGLPLTLAKRLTGDTEEEIRQDAEALLELVSPSKPVTQKPAVRLRGGGEPDREPDETDLSKIGARMFRR